MILTEFNLVEESTGYKQQSQHGRHSQVRIGARLPAVPNWAKYFPALAAANSRGSLFDPSMTIPKRHSAPENIVSGQHTFFVTTSTDGKRFLLQSDRMATLLIEVLFHYRDQGEYRLHDFVVMPNHFHAQITIGVNASIERAMQLIKGGFSYRAKRELGIGRTIWQRGFSEDRVSSREELLAFRKYIYENQVKAGLAKTPEEYPYSSAHPKFKRTKTAAAKAGDS